MRIPFVDRNIATNQLIQFSILFYWSLFWLFNIVDKVIGGSMFLWVGRDAIDNQVELISRSKEIQLKLSSKEIVEKFLNESKLM